ncbi:MAG: hypothetical protein CMD06_02775 [Flavobacteriales bacterium]|nr:hypothetical protein [Flavobacteriales bacterium]
MKKILIALFVISINIHAQNTLVSMQSDYKNQIFYSMSNGEVLNVQNDDWDISFSTEIMSSTIRINGGKGVELFTYPLGDTSSWNNINTSTPNILTNVMHNSDTSWAMGAFDKYTLGGFDYGWGVYNLQTHHVVGDSLFLIRTVNGNWKKLWIKRKVAGEYIFKYADLDGSNIMDQSIIASNYSDKRFIYFSLDQNQIIDREPNLLEWDITFTKYITDYPFQGSFVPYSVTGALINDGVEVAKALNIASPSTYTDYSQHDFETIINSIGFDWKTYQGSYVVDNSRCYFIKDLSNNIWRLFFTSFDGASTGNIEFNTEMVSSPASVGNLLKENKLVIYPNPTSGNSKLILDLKESINTISVYDMFGKIIFQEKVNINSFSYIDIPSSEFNSGVYIINISNGSKVVKEQKLVVY